MCQGDLDKEFPTVRNTFFDRHRDCKSFAVLLGHFACTEPSKQA